MHVQIYTVSLNYLPRQFHSNYDKLMNVRVCAYVAQDMSEKANPHIQLY